MEITIKFNGKYLKVIIPSILSFIMMFLIITYNNTFIFDELMRFIGFSLTFLFLLTLILWAIWYYLDLLVRF